MTVSKQENLAPKERAAMVKEAVHYFDEAVRANKTSVDVLCEHGIFRRSLGSSHFNRA